MSTVSFLCGFAGTVTAIIGFQCKSQLSILLSQILANAFTALSYLFLGLSNISGFVVCLIAGLQTVVNYFFLRKDKSVPRWLVAGFLAGYLFSFALTVYLSGHCRFPYDVLPFVCALLFLCIMVTVRPSVTRLLVFISTAFWLVYDCTGESLAAGNLVTHICVMLSVVIGILRYDFYPRFSRR